MGPMVNKLDAEGPRAGGCPEREKVPGALIPCVVPRISGKEIYLEILPRLSRPRSYLEQERKMCSRVSTSA